MLDRLLEEDDLELDAVSGASAGAINAVLLASGLAKGGPDEARASLERFWSSVGQSSAKNLFLHPELVVATASQLSPYQFNPLELNPLRDLLAQEVDFEAIRTRSPVRLLVSATRVQDGAVRVFRTKAISLEVVLASACLPRLHHSVNIHGEAHWDGGYAANPPVIPLVGASRTSNVLAGPADPHGSRGLAGDQVGDRQAVGPDHVQRPAPEGAGGDRDDEEAGPQGGRADLAPGPQDQQLAASSSVCGELCGRAQQASVLNTKWDFLSHLRDRGRAAADTWLAEAFASTAGKLRRPAPSAEAQVALTT